MVKNNKIILSLVVIVGLLLFSIWSHIYQANQIEGIRLSGNPPDEIAGGISRVAIGTQTKWTTDLVPSSSFTVNLGSSALPVNNYFGTGASFSGNLNWLGELKPDGVLCSNDQILKRTGADNWDCAADVTGAASNSLNFDEFQNPLVLDTNITTTSGSFNWDFGFTNFANVGSASFSRGFKVGNNLFRVSPTGIVSTGEWQGTAIVDAYVADAITVDWAGLQAYPTGCTNQFVRTIGDILTCATVVDADVADAISIIGGTIGANNISGLQTTTAALTIGDGGDTITIDSFNWDVSSAGLFSGLTGLTTTGDFFGANASLSGNFELAAGSQLSGAGLADCDVSTKVLRWDTTTRLFSCGTLADADIPDTITASNYLLLTGGTLTGNLAGTTASLSGNFQTSNRIISGTASHSFGGTIEGLTDNTLSFGTTAKKIKQIVVNTLRVIVKFVLPQNITLTETGEMTIQTTSKSLDWYDGSNTIVERNKKCFSFYVEAPTSSNPEWIGQVRFDDPFTITSVQAIASGANASGWNLIYGPPGSQTTKVFTADKSASTSTYPTYTSFTNSTILDNNVLSYVVASNSAVQKSNTATICGRYNH